MMCDNNHIYLYLHDCVGNTNKYDIVIHEMRDRVRELGHSALSNIPIGNLTLGNIKEMKGWIEQDVENDNLTYFMEKIDKTLEVIQENYHKSVVSDLRNQGYLVVKQTKLDEAIEKLTNL